MRQNEYEYELAKLRAERDTLEGYNDHLLKIVDDLKVKITHLEKENEQLKTDNDAVIKETYNDFSLRWESLQREWVKEYGSITPWEADYLYDVARGIKNSSPEQYIEYYDMR